MLFEDIAILLCLSKFHDNTIWTIIEICGEMCYFLLWEINAHLNRNYVFKRKKRKTFFLPPSMSNLRKPTVWLLQPIYDIVMSDIFPFC